MFSRWMPPANAPAAGAKARAVLVALGLFAAWTVWYLAHHVVAAALAAGFVALMVLASRLHDVRLARRARDRAGEDIGTFARAFDRRAPHFDPWVIRAVWDGLAPWTALQGGGRFPLRPDDVIADLGCVDEDLEDVAVTAARRARRSVDDSRSNPYHGRVSTVGDLVAFIAHQPRGVAA